MPINTLHTLAGVVTESGQVRQITDQSIDPGLEELITSAAGQVDPTHSAILSQAPSLSFTATDLARALDAVGLNALGLSADFEMYLQKYANAGLRETGANHIKLSGATGMVIPRQISWEQGQPATISYDVLLTSADGTTAPLAVTADQTLPAFAGVDELFTTGPVSVNGSAITGIRGGSIDFGFTERIERSEGELFNTFVGIDGRQPSITLRSTEMTELNNFSAGQAVAAGNIVIHLRKIARNGTRVPDATAKHIRFTIDDGQIFARETSVAHQDVAELQLDIVPIFDGTNDIIAINTATAIS